MATVVLPKPEPSPDETLSDIKGFVEDVKDTLKSDKRAKRKADKEQLDVTERMSENMEWFGSMYEQTNTGKKAKLRDKLSEGWTKVFKNKWFEGIFGFMRRMSLGGIGDFLGLLLGIFVLIQTGLLDVLIPILINMAQVLITAIIKYLPRFIKFLIHILKDVLPPFFETIFNTILDAVGVGKNSPLRKLVKPLSKILPWLLAFGLLIGKFLPMITTAVRFLKPILSGLWKFLPHIGKLLAGLNPVGIAAIIIAAVWIFAEEIVGMFDWIIEKVFDLVFSFFPSLKPFKDVIVSMVKAFFQMVTPIYSIARLFANIKKLGFLEGFKKTIKEFLGGFADIGGAIAGFFLGWSPKKTKEEIAKTKKILFDMFDKFTSFLKENVLPIWTKVKKAFSSAFNMIVDTFKKVWEKIKKIGKELFDEIISTLSEIFGIYSFDDLVKRVKNAINIISGMFDKVKSFLKENILPVWTEVTKVFSSAWTEVKKIFSSAFDMIVGTFKEVWGEIKPIGMELIDEIKSIFSEIFGIFSEIFGGLFSSDTEKQASGTEKQISGFKTFMEFLIKILKTGMEVFIKILKISLKILKPFLKIFSKIFITGFKVFAKILKGLLVVIKFFVSIVGKLVRGFQKLKDMFTGGGLSKTLGNLGKTIIDVIGGAFTSVKDAFKNAFSSVFDAFLGLFDMLIYHISQYIPKMEDRGEAYKVDSAEAYATEQAYIRAYAEKYKIDDDKLHEIAKGKVSEKYIKAGAEMDFYKNIRNLKYMGEGQQIAHLKELVKAVREGNDKKGSTKVIDSSGVSQTSTALRKNRQGLPE